MLQWQRREGKHSEQEQPSSLASLVTRVRARIVMEGERVKFFHVPSLRSDKTRQTSTNLP